MGALAGLAAVSSTLAETSDLWGKNGEKWTTDGRLDDWSYAGYCFGERKIPNPPAQINVRDFGAKGDGKTDDSAAFKKALAEGQGKVIFIPKGTYVLTDRVELSGHCTILRGESRDETVLYMPKGLEDVYPSPTKNASGTPTTRWSFGGGFIQINSEKLHDGKMLPVTGNAPRGTKRVKLATAGALKAGDQVLMIWNNDEANTLAKVVYDGDLSEGEDMGAKPNRQQVNKVMAVNDAEVELLRPLRFPVMPELSCELVKVAPATSGCGVEDLTLKFESGIYRGHFKERGFNGVDVSANALHCWVRRLRIVDADGGILRAGTHGTVEDIILEASRKSTAMNNWTGHHGVDAGRDCLVQRITFHTSFFHDLSVSSADSGNVFRQVKGVDLNMDHHRRGPCYNLFTDIDLGSGSRPWYSGGGAKRGKHSGVGNTYWNFHSKGPIGLPSTRFGPPALQFVGLPMDVKDRKKPDAWWVESIPPGELEPQDLYAAQLARRLAGEARMLSKE